MKKERYIKFIIDTEELKAKYETTAKGLDSMHILFNSEGMTKELQIIDEARRICGKILHKEIFEY